MLHLLTKRNRRILTVVQNYNHFTEVDYDAKTETNAIFKVSAKEIIAFLTLTIRQIQGDGKTWASR